MVHLASEAASAPIGHPAAEGASPLDLQQFCGTDEIRSYLMKPFSRDGYTWATNGHIMVRVALASDISDIDIQINSQAVLKGLDDQTFFRPSFELPPKPKIADCPSCDGRGFAHECPDCECECETCDGKGQCDGDRLWSTSIGPRIFALNYVRQVLSLPDIELATFSEPGDEKPMLFRFAGGVGALMPMRSEKANHIDIKLTAADA